MKKSPLILTCLLAGFAGGTLSHWIQNHLFNEAVATESKQVTAQAFNLVDGSGKLRAQLAFSKEGPPGLFLMDEQGRARGIIGLYPDGTPFLVMNDRNSSATHVLRTFGSEEAPLMIFKNKGRDEMILGLNPGGSRPEPFLMRYDQTRSRKVEFGKYDGP